MKCKLCFNKNYIDGFCKKHFTTEVINKIWDDTETEG